MYPTVLRRTSRVPLSNGLLDQPLFIPQPTKTELRVHNAFQKTVQRNRKGVNKYDRFIGQLEERRVSFKHEMHHVAQKGRLTLLWRVRKLIKKEFGENYWVDTFGSSKYGAASANSDMDLIILDNERRTGFNPYAPNKLPNVYNIKKLASTLRKDGFINVKAIPATVPIVKFKDKATGIQCDINVNDQPGYWNSILIREYARCSPSFLPMVTAIKLWAKPLGLNSPSPERAGELVTFSSYALALMTIAFMQSRQLLPNLQDNVRNLEERPFWNRKPIYLCDMRFKKKEHSILSFRRDPDANVIALLADWFELWSNFNPENQMVDIRLGGILPRVSPEPLAIESSSEELEPLDQLVELFDQRASGSEIPEEPIIEQEDSVDAKADPTAEASGPGLLEPTSRVRFNELQYDPKALQRWEHNAFCLIDPFIRIRNIGQNISRGVFDHFQDECRQAGAALRGRTSVEGVEGN